MSTKTTKFIGFPNQNKNKGWLNSKSKSWNKKNKNKNMAHEEQESNKILLQGRNENIIRLWQKKVFKIGVKQTKDNAEFYFYLYPLGT